ncbi:MAG: FAD-dependent monooxygenase [Mucilaginibacter polytrichastri]|nr:FAD-dependent monooxygenase [Mucilaginibacter polytrichastri]
MILQNKHIAIVGGGPGGLTLARLLQRKGADVKLYERDADKHARVQGSPLDMHEKSGVAALHEAGLTDTLNAHVHTGADKKIITNEKAEICFSDHGIKTASAPEIDRGELRKILLESLQSETVVWDSYFTSLEPHNQGWLLNFKNGSTAYADVVIAADGANSKIRPYITDVKPRYSGFLMLEIFVPDAEISAPGIWKLLNGGKVMAFGNSKCILGGQKGTGDLGFYLSFKADENWSANSGLNFSDKQQLLPWFRSAYAKWSPAWEEIINSAAMPLIPRPIYYMPDEVWPPLPNLTMLGDAAHVMPPFAGEGANTAMRDALELSGLLTGNAYESIHKAIMAFEKNMRKRSSLATQQSLRNGERMHSENALDQMLAIFGNS